MECNKDDAIKAKEIAVRKLNNKDIRGAQKFALKAQQLYPGLEGIAQMLVTLDIHATSENRIIGESDWYGVLGISPQADEDAIRKQYRKLALILHPDKNKSIGAEGAFKSVSQAWSVLSDKSRRAAYDAKRSLWSESPNVGPTRPSGPNGMYNFPKKASPHPYFKNNTNGHRSKGSNGCSTAGLRDSKSNCNTFWTICHRCRIQYEYLRTYLNQNLLCQRCREPFFAKEQPPPDPKSSRSVKPSKSGKNSRNSQQDFQWVPFSGVGNSSSSTVAQAANVVQQTYEKVKRVREEAQAANKRDKTMKRKSSFQENVCSSSTDKKQRVGDSLNNSGVSSANELQNFLMDKARKEIFSQLTDYKSSSNLSAKKLKTSEAVAHSDFDDVGLSNVVRLSIPVPEPDFHDFDLNRTEKNFEEGQVWAVYDDTDGMPKNYVKIHRIISQDPFKLRISWLNSKTSSEIARACGEFRIGSSYQTYDTVDCFSHKVHQWRKDSHGAVCIFPRKGDAWALYRNWDELTNDVVKVKYDMVEVLEDYDEDLGVVVIPLVKVTGFKALFRRHLDFEQVRRIPNEEMSRFSHQIPSYLISGKETTNALKGCRELDPAAVPLDFLQVIGVSKTKETMKEVT